MRDEEGFVKKKKKWLACLGGFNGLEYGVVTGGGGGGGAPFRHFPLSSVFYLSSFFLSDLFSFFIYIYIWIFGIWCVFGLVHVFFGSLVFPPFSYGLCLSIALLPFPSFPSIFILGEKTHLKFFYIFYSVLKLNYNLWKMSYFNL